MGLKEKTSLPWNPQSKSILERIHQVLRDCLTTFKLEELDIDEDKDEDPFQEFLTMASYAIRCAFHKTHGYSPGQLVFGRDMFMPIETTIDWDSIKERKQKAICKSNERENSKRIHRQYEKGDWITIQKPGILRKLSIPRLGPYKVLKHHTNSDITYQKEPFVEDKVNIRMIYSYFQKHNNAIEEFFQLIIKVR